MAKRRMIAASLGSSRKFAEVPKLAGELGEFAQLLYPLLITHADDFGRQSGDPFTVKHAVFPTSPRSEAEFGAALAAMQAAKLIVWYEADGAQVIEICEFEREQPGLHKRTKSRFPASDSGNVRELPGNSHATELNRTELNRTELKGTEGAVRTTRGQAFAGKRIRVPAFLHEELGRLKGSVEFDLIGWYPQLDAELAKSNEPIRDEIAYVRERFYEAAGIDRPNLYGRKRVAPVFDPTPSVEDSAKRRAAEPELTPEQRKASIEALRQARKGAA